MLKGNESKKRNRLPWQRKFAPETKVALFFFFLSPFSEHPYTTWAWGLETVLNYLGVGFEVDQRPCARWLVGRDNPHYCYCLEFRNRNDITK